jgi:alpha-1,4-digalacturonate transport system substrate-binding protein
VVDAGFRAFSERMQAWHAAGLMPRDIWPGLTGTRWRTGGDMFINQDVVMHLTGSWSIQRFAEAIGNRFEWVAVPPPCGPANCSGMPGGTAVVAFRQTRHPAEVGRLMQFLVSEPVLKYYYERTFALPAHRGLARTGLDYPPETPPAAVAALRSFTASIERLTPLSHRLQAYGRNAVIFDTIVSQIGDALAGRGNLEDAYRRIEDEVADRTR